MDLAHPIKINTNFLKKIEGSCPPILLISSLPIFQRILKSDTYRNLDRRILLDLQGTFFPQDSLQTGAIVALDHDEWAISQ